ncbi:MAG: hypothetical protein ACC630_02140 [Nitrospinota bacterium]
MIKSGSQGAITKKGIFFLLVIGIVGYYLLPPIIKYGRLQYEITDIAGKAGLYTDKQIAANIISEAKKLNILLAEEDIVIDRNDKAEMIRIEIEYSDTIIFPGNYKYTLNFHPKIHRKFSRKKYQF